MSRPPSASTATARAPSITDLTPTDHPGRSEDIAAGVACLPAMTRPSSLGSNFYIDGETRTFLPGTGNLPDRDVPAEALRRLRVREEYGGRPVHFSPSTAGELCVACPPHRRLTKDDPS
jgi:hypothetical protein